MSKTGKVFIIGVTGLIGKHLLRSGFVCCGNSQPPEIKIFSRQLHPKYETIVCDLFLR